LHAIIVLESDCLCISQVLRPGDWTEQLLSAVTKLGCCLLDTHVLNFPSKALGSFVQEPTAPGLLDALAAAQAVAAAEQARLLAAQQGRGGSAQGLGSVQAKWQQRLQQLSAAERHHLRTYLLQAKWFARPAPGGSSVSGSGVSGSSGSGSDVSGFNQQQLQVLRSLPVYEVHPRLPYEEEDNAATTTSSSSRAQLAQQDVGLLGLLQPAASSAAAVAGAGTAQYMSLSSPSGQQQQQLLLPPKGITIGAVLGSHFLKCESDSEEQVLTQHLGVRRLLMQEFLMLHLAKAPQQLDPRALVSTVAHVLYRLKELSVNEPDLPLSIKGLQVIPTRAGYSSSSSQGATGPPEQPQQQGRQQLVLAAPFELFDPSNAVLLELLNVHHFPTAPFDGCVDSRAPGGVTGAVAAAVEAKVLLEGLTICGLRRELDLEVSSIHALVCGWQPSKASCAIDVGMPLDSRGSVYQYSRLNPYRVFMAQG
jgi:hypothetical protein